MFPSVTTVIFIAIVSSLVNGYPQAKILGGIDAPASFAPYQVIITLRDVLQCSGVIIHQHAVLTAAQCFSGESPSWFNIISGTHNLNEGGKVYRLHDYVLHTQYNKYDLKNDIALGIIRDPLELGPNVTPITVTSSVIDGDVLVVTSGWGMTSTSPAFSDNMKMAFLKTVDNKKCAEVWSGNTAHVAMSEICTMPRFGEGMCYGDGGNPLVYNNTLIGIGSWGVPCGLGYPDVYQRTSYYIQWIYKTLDDSLNTHHLTPK